MHITANIHIHIRLNGDRDAKSLEKKDTKNVYDLYIQTYRHRLHEFPFYRPRNFESEWTQNERKKWQNANNSSCSIFFLISNQKLQQK